MLEGHRDDERLGICVGHQRRDLVQLLVGDGTGQRRVHVHAVIGEVLGDRLRIRLVGFRLAHVAALRRRTKNQPISPMAPATPPPNEPISTPAAIVPAVPPQ